MCFLDLKTFTELTVSPVKKRKRVETTSTSESESEVQTLSPKRKQIRGRRKSQSPEKDKKIKQTGDSDTKSEKINKSGKQTKTIASKGNGKCDRGKNPKSSKHSGKGNHGDKKRTIEMTSDDGFLSIWTEKRSIPSLDYNESNAKCPLPGCDSAGKIVHK